MKQWLVGVLFLFSTVAPLAQAGDLPDFTQLVEKEGPTVVLVTTTSTVNVNANALALPFPFLSPFGDPFGQGGEQPQQHQKRSGLGSGFIIDPDGYILTNAHVVDDADEITVKLNDKKEYKATVVGLDKLTDVALIKIDAKNLPAVTMGSSEALKPGEWVVAIGAPFGFEHTVTAGIVSFKGRTMADNVVVPFIQSNVAVNPGNSGGPLFNMKGEAVGINSMIYSPVGAYVGYSFSVPIDLARDIADQLRKNGKISRGLLGVKMQSLSDKLAKAMGLSSSDGALIAQVMNDTPAQRVGLKAGDVITAVGDTKIVEMSDLQRVIAMAHGGDTVELHVLRDNKDKEFKVTLDEAEKGEPGAKKAAKNAAAKGKVRLGLQLAPLSSQEAAELGVPFALQVQAVAPNSPASDAGLRPGEFITGVAGQDLKSVEQFEQFLNTLKPGSTLALRVLRNDSSEFVAIEIPAEK